MKFIKQRMAATLLADGPWVALRLHEEGPEEEAVYLAFALTTQGIAAQIVPAVLLDDWGKEIKGLALYDWVQEHGWRFPRAELFGVSPHGEAVQYFLRDMELLAPWVVYAAADKSLPIGDWLPVQAVLLPDGALFAPEPAEVPPDLTGPLRVGRVAWWRVPPDTIDLSFLEPPAG